MIKIKRIIFTSNSSWDLYNFRGEIISLFLAKGFEVICLIPKDGKELFLEKLGAKVLDIPLDRKGTNIKNDLKLLFILIKKYKKLKPNLIFHYTIKPNIYGSIAAKLSKVKSISIIPGLGYTFINKGLLASIVKYMYKFALRFPNEVWVLNDDDKKELIEKNIVKKEKLKVLPSEGIDLEKFKPLEKERKDEKIVFLMIARVLYDKGFKEYAEAAKIIKEKYSNVEFQLLGGIDSGNPSGVPESEIMSYNNNKIINYLGTTTNVVDVIKESNCMVLPSFYREGVPRTLMEAAAMEIPIITTDNVGCREVVDDGVNGYLCEVKNVEDLVSKIEKFIELSKEEKKEMGKKGRKKVEKEMNIEIVKKKYNKIILS